MDDFRAFWKEQQRNLLQKNKEGVRPIDAGALTMGERVSNAKSGEDMYQMLIYSKGAYVLHMLEMMYWTPQDGETRSSARCSSSSRTTRARRRPPRTGRLRWRRTMPKSMDLRGDGKLDWFFNEYVYGTELPHYSMTTDFRSADGVPACT